MLDPQARPAVMPCLPAGLKITPIPAFKDNYIWCLSDGQSAWIVDPGEAAPVLAYLAKHSLRLSGVLVTHYHADHTGGIAALVEELGQAHAIPVYAPAAENVLGTSHPLVGGEAIEICGLRCEVKAIPAHTRGHLAFYFPSFGGLFCGDTLFGAGCGRLFEGNQADLYAALSWIRNLPDQTAIFCAHEYTRANLNFARAVEPGNLAIQQRIEETDRLRAANLPTVPSLLSLEYATNPFLRWDVPTVREAVMVQEPNAKCDEDVLGALRRWKDVF